MCGDCVYWYPDVVWMIQLLFFFSVWIFCFLILLYVFFFFFFFQAEDGIRDGTVTGVQTCALPICSREPFPSSCLIRKAMLESPPCVRGIAQELIGTKGKLHEHSIAPFTAGSSHRYGTRAHLASGLIHSLCRQTPGRRNRRHPHYEAADAHRLPRDSGDCLHHFRCLGPGSGHLQ